MADPKPGLAERLAAYEAFLDAIVPESAYWAGKREDTDRVQFLADAVSDPSTVLRRADDTDRH